MEIQIIEGSHGGLQVALIACVLDGVKDLGEDRGVFGHLKRIFTFSDP